jgi:hypothetical protein
VTTLHDAAQQALEALEWHYRQGHSNTLGGFRLKIDEKALRNLRAALAQQDEPTPPPEAVSEAEKTAYAAGWWAALTQQAEPKTNWCGETCERAKLCAICARELAGVQAEPVAWIDDSGHPKHRLYLQSATEKRLYGPLRPLYTAPPQRKPLTEDEIAKMYAGCKYGSVVELARSIERAHGIGGDDGQA